MKKIAVVYMAHDGFASLYSGVGTIARDFLLSFPTVSAQLKGRYQQTQFTLFAATMKYREGSFALSPKVRADTLKITDDNESIHFVELNNGSGAKDAYGELENWRFASISAATFVYTIAKQFDRVLVIAVDTPFAQVANYFLDTYDDKNVSFVWLPQSTVKIHKYGMSSDKNQQGDFYETQRFAWEKGIVDLAGARENVSIGCVGEFMREHLVADYGALPHKLVDIPNSLYPERLKSNIAAQPKIGAFLKNLGVPLDRPLLFSFGRAEPYKGLDLVLKNSHDLIKRKNYFVLIFAAPYSMTDPYLQELNDLAATDKDNIKIVYGLDFTAPHYVMQWRNTSILAILSRAEPFGLIPIESRFYNNPNMSLLTSDRDGFKYQISDGIDGFLTDLSDQNIQDKFAMLADMPRARKEEIAKAGYTRISDQYNQVNVNIRMLDNYVSSS